MIVFERQEAVAAEAIEHEAIEATVVDTEVVDAILVEHDDAAIIETDIIETEIIETDVVEAVELTEEEPRRHLRVAPDGYRRRRRVRIAAAAAGVSLSATLFAVVGFNVVLAQNQIELQDLQHKLQVEESRYYDLRNEVAEASSPQRIVTKASSIGLVSAPLTYVPAPIRPPALGPTDTAETLLETSRATGGSLDHPVP